MLREIDHFKHRLLSPKEWAFYVFHTGKDLEERAEQEEVRMRTLLKMTILGIHNPKTAWEILHDRPTGRHTGPNDEWEFALSDRYFRMQLEGPPPEVLAQFERHASQR